VKKILKGSVVFQHNIYCLYGLTFHL